MYYSANFRYKILINQMNNHNQKPIDMFNKEDVTVYRSDFQSIIKSSNEAII